MKLRIHGISIRFRLSQEGVAALVSKGKLEESVQLTPAASDSFTYVLEKSSPCREGRAWRSDCKIGVTLPDDLVRAWATTDQVGIEETRPVGEGALLQIAVERDFRRLHSRTDEDEGDAGVIEWPSFLLQFRQFNSANPPSKFIEAFRQVMLRRVQGRRYEKHLAPHVQRQVRPHGARARMLSIPVSDT